MEKLKQKGLCARIARRRRQGSEVIKGQDQGLEMRLRKQRQHSGPETREDEDYLTHEDPRGAAGHT